MRDKFDIFTLQRLFTLKGQGHAVFITKWQTVDIIANLSAINRCNHPRTITLDIVVDISGGKEALDKLRQ